MASIRSFRDLVVWRLAMDLAVKAYQVTETFPRREHFGLAAQIRKTSVSIPSNIAEGHNRSSRAAYRNHVAIGLGSQAELETQLELARRLSLVEPTTIDELIQLAANVGRMLHRLLAALDSTSSSAKAGFPSA